MVLGSSLFEMYGYCSVHILTYYIYEVQETPLLLAENLGRSLVEVTITTML